MTRFNLNKTAVIFSVALATMTAATGASAQQYIAEELLDQQIEQSNDQTAKSEEQVSDENRGSVTGKVFNPAYAAAITDTIV